MNRIFDNLANNGIPNKLEIITIMDRSGSMAGLRQDIIGGYNSFLMEQRTLPGQARATLVQFNNEVETLYQGVPIQHLGNLTQATYIPIGSTALYDAIGFALNAQGARIRAEGWADKVLVNIATDGEENTSREFSLEVVKAMIRRFQDEHGWTFLFQAANQDAFKTGAGFGISGATTRNFTASAAGVTEAYNTMSLYATNLRSGL